METTVSTVKYLTECLLKQRMDISEVIEKLFSEVMVLENHPTIQDPQLEECALALWNWSVTSRGNTMLTKIQRAKVMSFIVSHVACTLIFCCETDCPAEGSMRARILMSSKTGRLWLDCKDPQMADKLFRLATKSLESLYNQLISRGDASGDKCDYKVDVEKDLLRVLSYQAESAVSQEQNQEAVMLMQRCKDMLLRVPKETTYLSLMCYNFGVEMYYRKQFDCSASWLGQSYDIGKMNGKFALDAETQAKVLRLLATVYFEWDCQKYHEKALEAVTQANKECVSSSGLYLKIQILLKANIPDDHIKAGLKEMLESKVSLEICLRTVKLLMSEDREVLAFEFLKHVCQHFESSPDLGTALVLHIELLLQRGKELLGKQKIEDVITGHHTGRKLTLRALTSLHVMLWDKASINYEAGNYSDALLWYNYSLSFYKAGLMDSNLAKLQRNRTSCFLHLKQLEKAKDAIKEAERCEPDNIFTHFIVYKIAVLENDVEKATQAITRMGLQSKDSQASKDSILVSTVAASNLLSLAAQIALENGQEDTATKALESLCEHSNDDDQVLTALRCLVRLVLSKIEKSSDETGTENVDVLLPYLKMAFQRMSHQSCLTAEQCIEKANWFRKMAWNMALQCKTRPDSMRDFFVLAYQFFQMCPPDRVRLEGQRTSLLMAAAACLESCRISPHEDKTQDLTQALKHIQLCSEICKTLRASGSSSNDTVESLLLMYEFAVRSKLNDPEVATVLESVLELEKVEPKVLETIAGLAMEPPAHLPLLCKKALRVALALHMKQPQPDLEHCRKYIHSLIKLSLPSGVSEVDAHVLEEVWGYYEEALSIITVEENFPEMEILWLLIQAWNTGIHLYSLTQYPEAEQWCGLAMRFIRHLGPSQESYKSKMSGLYSEILERLDKTKRV
ncbi:testis-expressed protein 11 [Synchiropus splendidus]|uniref:testis-expressed protein 11 n=1 Tax=Synchiropus splendidus TaxID=270530 RepID=UPI00237D9A37|nr:testis-expressed protein 11 [Synchiropus splendidus]